MKIFPAFTFFTLLLLAALPLSGKEETVKIYESLTKAGADGAQERHTVQLSGPFVNFDLNYVTRNGSSEGVGDPYSAAISINNMPAAPTLAFNVIGAGFSLGQQPIPIDLFKEDPERKGIQAAWTLPGGNVTLTLVVNGSDPVLYGRLRVERAESFQILMLLAPGGYTPASDTRDRWVFAGNEDRQHGKEPLKMASNWLLLYDKLLDPESSKGKGAAGFLWESLPGSEVSFQCGDYVSTFSVKMPAESGEKEFDFMLWPFEGVPNESAKAEIKEHSTAMLEKFSREKDRIFNNLTSR